MFTEKRGLAALFRFRPADHCRRPVPLISLSGFL
jgi:hypothetical protein